MLSRLGICGCKRRDVVAERDGEEREGTDQQQQQQQETTGASVDASGQTVFYSAQQCLFELSSGTSLDKPGSVIGIVPSNVKNTVVFRKGLEETQEVIDSAVGYPGHLTQTQLQTCLEFRNKLKDDATKREMVYIYKQVEEEPYAICRFMRARKFDIAQVWSMMEANQDVFSKGKLQDFYPNPQDALGGVAESAWLTQFPLLLGGLAQNGCPIAYLITGRITVEGMDACINLQEHIPNYVWYFVVHKLQRHIVSLKAQNPNRFVRLQLLVIVDLKDLSLSLLRHVLPVLEQALKILQVFPELLFSVVIINTPRFFTGFWPLIKAFLDPATAQKFELYSGNAHGRLEKLGYQELARDYGGTATSTLDLPIVDNPTIQRQVVQLVPSHKTKEAVFGFHVKPNETATITIYTNASNGASIVLKHDGVVVNKVIMSRDSNEAKDRPFSRELGVCNQPGSYKVTVTRHAGPATEHFLVVGDVS